MLNGVQRGEGANGGRSRATWLGFVGIAGLFAAGCGGSADGAVAKRDSAATGSSGAGTNPSSAAAQTVPPQGGIGSAPAPSSAPAGDALAMSLPNSAPPLSYPAIVGNVPPPADPSPPPPVSSEPPRPTTPAPAVVVVPPHDCHFDYLGDWVRCENAGWPNVTVSSASDLVGCMQECLQHDDCTAVTDYFWLGIPDLGCYLYTSSCDAPVNHPVWAEEDGGRDYRRGACGTAPDAGR